MNGVYGTTIPSNVTSDMVDIYYAYHKTRSSDSVADSTFTKLSSTILSNAIYEADDESLDSLLEGMYTLKLPVQIFNRKGFYTVYIKPKEVASNILDVGVLTAFPDIKGIVLDTSMIKDDNTKSKALANNSLVGYRIIYFDDNGSRLPYYRIITSNNKCEPVANNPSNSSDKSYTYRYDDSSTLTFLTVTPSMAPSFKASAEPYIGKVNQKIALVNTDFEPVMLDIEMVDHDADTISYMLEGTQLRNLDGGLVTTFNENNEIYHQSEHYTLKDNYTGNPVYEVRQNKTDNIDFTQDITTITNGQ